VADHRINDVPITPEFVRFRSGFGQRFLVTVDVEEEFDWGAPLDRHQQGVEAVPALRKFQQFCEGFDVSPVYLVDYPIATSQVARAALRQSVTDGRAEVGVHLHPWVNPPHDEQVNTFNSYAGNLPADLERAKLMLLRDAIERNFGAVPRIYRAGRYGAGANTAKVLREADITIDSSVRSGFDYSADGGPNYVDHPLQPYWIDREAKLLELPLTTVYSGALSRMGPSLYPRMWRTPALRGALAHARLLDRIPLTPEGISAKEAIRAIDVAADMKLPILVLSFHSPSLMAGNMSYVRNSDDLDAFYDWWRAIFAHLALRNIVSTGIGEIIDAVELA
jgi:hypothetical protein